MAINIPVALTSEEEAALAAQAKAEGVSIDSLLRKAVVQLITSAPQLQSPKLNGEQWEREFEAWLDSLPEMPTLSDKAISRESIYTREDEWQ